MKADKRQQLLIILTVAIVGLFALDKLVLTPLMASWKARSDEVAKLRKDITAGKGVIQRESFTRKRWNEMRKNTLPVNASQAEQEMLRAFDKWSQESRISVSSIRPQWKRGTTSDHSLLECRLDAAGSLSALTKFMHLLELSPMALKVETIELTTRDNNGSQIAMGLLVTGLRLAPLEGK
jgi:hypothetical protein